MASLAEDSEKSILTFVHRFGRGIVCTLRIEKPEESDSPVILKANCEWIGRPRKKHVNQYRQWVLTTQQHLSDLWQLRTLYVLGVAHNYTEIWKFAPGEPPKLVETLNGEIP